MQPHLIAGGADAAPGAVDDGTILYIDPNDPQAAEILQQAGLRLAEDGTVQQANIEGEGLNLEAAPVVEPGVTSTGGITATLAAQKPTEIPVKQASNGQQQVFEDAMVSHLFTPDFGYCGNSCSRCLIIVGGPDLRFWNVDYCNNFDTHTFFLSPTVL